MIAYTNFIGIDVGKFNFVVSVHGKNKVEEYANTPCGIKSFLKDYRPLLPISLCVLETTGGYEMRLLLNLCDKGYAVHRANTRKVKHFIYSLGNKAKTDSLDAKALAYYGYERGDRLPLFKPHSKQDLALYELTQRRCDLIKISVAEKNRAQAPCLNEKLVKEGCTMLIEVLEKQIESIDNKVNELIEQDAAFKAKRDVLITIPGIGQLTANMLLILMPELGTITRREIASLAGLAPRANDSGKMMGYRRTGGGRNTIRPILFLAAMAARRSNSRLKTFYEDLIANGKKKMVALVALMRKIIVVANAKLRDLYAGKSNTVEEENSQIKRACRQQPSKKVGSKKINKGVDNKKCINKKDNIIVCGPCGREARACG